MGDSLRGVGFGGLLEHFLSVGGITHQQLEDLKTALEALAEGGDTKEVLDTIDAVLDTIEGRIPSKGQKTKSGSVPVVLPSDMGSLAVSIDPPSLSSVAIDFSSGDAQTIIAAQGAGKRIRIASLVLTSLVNVEVAVKSGSTTIMTLQFSAVELSPRIPINLGTNEALVLDAVSADRITGGVSYYVEDVA